MLSLKQKMALASAASAAVEAEREMECPAELSVAQWAVESGWGTKQPGNNCFGIKYAARHAKVQLLMTTEVLRRAEMEPDDVVIQELLDGRVRVQGKREFAAYDSLHECFADHGKLIVYGVPYRDAWKRYKADGDVEALAIGIAKRYATDPIYANSLVRIMRMPEVQSAIAAARLPEAA